MKDTNLGSANNGANIFPANSTDKDAGMLLNAEIVNNAERFVEIRRDIHANPELGYHEERTSDLIAAKLTEWGITVYRGLGKTGVVGHIQGRPGPRAIGLRADMDALPMTELNTFGHASQASGKMHGCGHDGHTAMLLAAAQQLAMHRNFDGSVYLIFQPAEEGGAGARAMIQDGLFEKFPMDAIFGMHNWPGLPMGDFAVCSGPTLASAQIFKITIKGVGAHAALPHTGVDPLSVGFAIVQALPTIVTLNKKPAETAVLSVTMFHGGEACNVIPDRCEIQGTFRCFSAETESIIEKRMLEVVQNTAAAYGASAELELKRAAPFTVNSKNEAHFVRGTMQRLVGEARTHEFEPTLGGEDFGYFLMEKPGAFFFIGNGNGEHRAREGSDETSLGACTLHNPNYDFNDGCIPYGATLWVNLAKDWLANR